MRLPRKKLSLEEKIEVIREIVDDVAYMRTLSTETRHSYCSYLLNLQQKYHRMHGEYYTPTHPPKDI